MKKYYVPNRLFAEPSFSEGFSRVLDLGGVLQKYNMSHGEQETDMRAIENDWLAVGHDMYQAIIKYERNIKQTSKR